MRTLRQDIDLRFRDQWIGIVLVALFPRIATRKPGHDSLKRVLRRIAIGTAVQFTLRHWVQPRVKALAEDRKRAQEDLTRQLGREPTDDELMEHILRGRRADG